MSKNFNILIVDDDSYNLNILNLYLSELPEYIVVQANNAKLALNMVESKPPDLVITDWDMPGMSGLELLRRMKADEKKREIPVIMATAVMINPDNLKMAFDDGVFDFIRKPYERIELLARVKNALLLTDSFSTIKQKKRQIQELNERLVESHTNSLQMVNSVFEGIILLENLCITEVNHSFLNMTGFLFNELIGKPVLSLISKEFHDLVLSYLLKGDNIVPEIQIIKKDQSTICVEILAKHIFFNGMDNLICAFRDITERKLREEIIQKQNEQILLQEKDLLLKEKEKLNLELEYKRKQLISNAINLSKNIEKNNQIIRSLEGLIPYLNKQAKELLLNITDQYRIEEKDESWHEFEIRFEDVHTDFYKKLIEITPDLTPTEKRLCAFLRLDMTTKEIAAITHLQPDSINVMRSRLRNKLKLDRDENVSVWLGKL